MKKFFVINILILFISPVIACFAAVPHYEAIVDAGSSGSRLHLYQYQSSDSLPQVKNILTIKIKPGISSTKDDPSSVGPLMGKLFDGLTEQLEGMQLSPKDVPISILATAGMRLLSKKEQQEIYSSLHGYIKSHYKFPIKSIGTIKGKMEGVYAWLDVNYLSHSLEEGKPKIGIIDLGGASTQIAYTTLEEHSADVANISVNGVPIFILSKSFLGGGENQAHLTMAENPAAKNCYPLNFKVTHGTKGDFNFERCSLIYKNKVIDQLIPSSFVVPIDKRFIAFSGLYHIWNFFNFDEGSDQQKITARIKSICNHSWGEIQKLYPDIPEIYLSSYCANGVYAENLLFSAYNLTAERFAVKASIQGESIDWPLGALLYGLLASPEYTSKTEIANTIK